MVATFPAKPQSAPLHARNRALLEAMGRSTHRKAALHWRNALVTANLPLVRMVAERQRQHCHEPFDDLVSLGCFGLIRAVEAFDLAHDGSLSSFAVPYIRGAILQGLRDRHQPLHTPRRLRELHQRACRHQERRRQQGLPVAAIPQLAAELGCSTAQLEQAAAVQKALQVHSLDAPCRSNNPDSPASTLLEQLPSPDRPATDDPQRLWLREQLAQLSCQDQRLLIGNWVEGRSWADLGQELGLGAATARRQAEVLLDQLQRAAGQSSSNARPIARAAAQAV